MPRRRRTGRQYQRARHHLVKSISTPSPRRYSRRRAGVRKGARKKDTGKNVARRTLPNATTKTPGVDLAGGRQTQRVLAARGDPYDIVRQPADAIKDGALDRRVAAGHAGPSIQCRAEGVDRAPDYQKRVRAARG